MIEMIMGKQNCPPVVREEVMKYIDDSSGLNTIQQMQHLENLVNKYGFVPRAKRLTAEDYKNIYTYRIKKIVNERIDQLRKGENNLTEFVVPGVLSFIDLMKSSNITLYIASGTDRDDVMEEAKILGVERDFEKIFGPDNSMPDFSKDWLIGKMIDWHNTTPEQILIIGDGPVEIKAAKKHGCFALGVASVDNPSSQMYEDKYSVLSDAGADIIIPDFSQIGTLSNLLT